MKCFQKTVLIRGWLCFFLTTSCPWTTSGSAESKLQSISFHNDNNNDINSNTVEKGETRTKHGRAEGKTFGFIAGMTLLTTCLSSHVYVTRSRSLPKRPLLPRGLQAQLEPCRLLLQPEQESRVLPVQFSVRRSICATLRSQLWWRRQLWCWCSTEPVTATTAIHLPTCIFGSAIKPQPPPPRALHER